MSTIELPTIRSSARDAFIHYGSREGWRIALSVHRDSDALDRSNWSVITKDVLGVPDDRPEHAADVLHLASGQYQFWCGTCGANGFEWDSLADAREDAKAHAGDGLGDAAIESMSHALVGWVEHLLVRPSSSAERRAIEWRERLEDYAIADEENYSELEYNEEWCVRCDRDMRKDHPTTQCGKFRSREDAEETQRKWDARP